MAERGPLPGSLLSALGSLPLCRLTLYPQGRHSSRSAAWEQRQLCLSVLRFTTKPPFPHGCETKAGGFPLRITLGLGKRFKSRREGRGTHSTSVSHQSVGLSTLIETGHTHRSVPMSLAGERKRG